MLRRAPQRLRLQPSKQMLALLSRPMALVRLRKEKKRRSRSPRRRKQPKMEEPLWLPRKQLREVSQRRRKKRRRRKSRKRLTTEASLGSPLSLKRSVSIPSY